MKVIIELEVLTGEHLPDWDTYSGQVLVNLQPTNTFGVCVQSATIRAELTEEEQQRYSKKGDI